MAIGSAIEKTNFVHVYDEKGRQIFTKEYKQKNGDKLMGYTNSTVSIKKGKMLYTYDEKGKQISTKWI
ncbi:hypothetical protein [Arcobacter vandammei]|uniref:hypothetical protein n=1 Tax=Arcobacter vandammei TaxID=2782243 RepID=UPI0018DF39F6|nr:hypothetical protein [Arcobacter vandammei]